MSEQIKQDIAQVVYKYRQEAKGLEQAVDSIIALTEAQKILPKSDSNFDLSSGSPFSDVAKYYYHIMYNIINHISGGMKQFTMWIDDNRSVSLAIDQIGRHSGVRIYNVGRSVHSPNYILLDIRLAF